MGKRIDKDILGGISGAVATVVVSRWRALTVIRQRPARRHRKAPSPKQSRQNKTFKMIANFLKPVKKIVELGFQEPRNSKMTPVNMATSELLLNCIIQQEDGPGIDLPKVRFSRPIRSTQPAWNPSVLTEKERKITFTWELNPFPKKSTRLDDTVVVVCYNKKNPALSYTNISSIKRSELKFSCNKTKSEIGQEIFCYLFMVSADKKMVSETSFLGAVVVMA